MKKLLTSLVFLFVLIFNSTVANPIKINMERNLTPLSKNADFILLMKEKINLINKLKNNVSKEMLNKLKLQQASKQDYMEVIRKLGYENFNEFKEKQKYLDDLQLKLQKDYSDIFLNKERFDSEVKYLIDNKIILFSSSNDCNSLLWILSSICTLNFLLSTEPNAGEMWFACMALVTALFLDCEFN
ncbi:MAG: hypothetical protein KGZ59_07010 [Chitinophagaceae bacterium]|nr:hypothetical protein [Chitinophagaceae bacterium]